MPYCSQIGLSNPKSRSNALRISSLNVGERKFSVGSPGISRNIKKVRLATAHITRRRWTSRSRATRAKGGSRPPLFVRFQCFLHARGIVQLAVHQHVARVLQDLLRGVDIAVSARHLLLDAVIVPGRQR